MAEHTVENIIEAATALFARRGAEGVTVLDIAKRCNVASGTVIYHFKSKDNLLFMVSRNIFVRLHRDAQQAMLQTCTPLEAIHAFIDAFFSLADQNRDCVVFLARFDPFTRLDLGCFPNTDLLMLKEQYLGLFENCVKTGVAERSFNPVDPSTLRMLIWATLQGLCHKYCQISSLQDLSQELKRMITFRLTGSLGGAQFCPPSAGTL
ncbi:TetR/AcrR family transcriptional regulator [Fundidesulfovibrio putealis]|uniref:TetR/AcrR family transcriptional regulator n=1 Tax=Fundidesulfovibrio putealis TaxID=270496 RepID=UPI00048A0543|nr:TetR/AcrR family transcriptional regulator [Fundidesulfovibrio putealis]